jgi:hypothetical protein
MNKWVCIQAIRNESAKRGDIHGRFGLLKLLEETGKNSTRELTEKETNEFYRRMKND